MSHNATREALRRLYLARRDSTSQDMLEIAGRAIGTRLGTIESYRTAYRVGMYHAIGSEIPTGGMIQGVLNSGRVLLLPAVSSDDTMEFRVVKGYQDLVQGRFGIMEPRDRCDVSTPDVLVVPAICVSLGGERLGYGRGYYDSYLDANKVESVAVCLEKQLVRRIPFNPGDARVDWVVTERRLYKT